MKRTPRIILLAFVASVMGSSITAHGEVTMANFQSICIGRFLVDLPVDAQVSDSASYQWITLHKPVRVASFATVQQKIDGQANEFRTVRMIRNSYADSLTRAGGGDPDKEYGLTQLVGLDTDVPSQEVVLGYHPDPKDSVINTVIHKVIGQWDYVFDTQDFGADKYPNARQALQKAATQCGGQVISDRQIGSFTVGFSS
jgi:hypothetical protein